MNPDWPEFGLKTFIIYVRPPGDDSTGNGSEQFPFRTLQNAARYVPAKIPAGHRYIIDVTGITETLPTDYTLPPWEGAETVSQHCRSNIPSWQWLPAFARRTWQIE
jgi:hypothetical protein